MCLFSKTNTPLVASEDIIAYKLLVKVGNRYLTPFHGFKVKIGKVLVDRKKLNIGEGLDEFIIREGVFHTYKKIESAKFNKEKFNKENLVIFKCIIPKGTKYFEGETLWCTKCYASKKLIIKEEITD